MKINDYIKYVLNTEFIYKLDWYFTLFAIPRDLDGNSYLTKSEKGFEVRVNNKWEKLDDSKELPILNFNHELKLQKGDLLNLNDNITTTLGRIVLNQILLVRNFGSKLPYINNRISIKEIEKQIAKGLQNDVIKINEYFDFTNSVEFIQGLAPITNVSATYKNVLPPPNLDKVKKELITMYNQKYGPEWKKNRLRVLEYQEQLKKIDSEWLKDDPSNGKLLNSKIKDNARVKMFLTFGPEVGFNKDGSNMTFVENSLMEQYETDPKQLTAVFNASRSGSYDRGHETQKGGTAAKALLRSTSSYNIDGEDCGSKLGKDILVTKENAKLLEKRYILINGKTVLLEKPETYIGKTVSLRSPLYCQNKNSSYCVTCCGENMRGYKDGISMNVLSISNTIMTLSLKSMHNTQVKLKKVNILDTII